MLWKIMIYPIVVTLVCLTAATSNSLHDYGDHGRSTRELKIPETGTDGPYLPRDVTPIGYHVWLQPIPQEGHFAGVLVVNISCLSPTKTVTVHAGENLEPLKAEMEVIRPQEGYEDYREIKSVSVQRVRRVSPEDWCEITVSDQLQKGVFYQLRMEFKGTLGNETSESGIFVGTYNDDQSDDRWFVATDMRQNKAREVFPCFDEFPYKAPFTISIGRPEEMRSLSNMPLRKTEKQADRSGWVWDHFERSPPMSPFSVNFFIYDRDVIVPLEPRDDLGSVTLRSYVPVHLVEDMKEAENQILQTLEKIETFLRTRYPLPELQIVLSPGLKRHHDGFGLLLFSEQNYNDGYWPLHCLFNMADQWLVHLTTPHFWYETSFGNSLTQYVSTVGFLETLKDTEIGDVFNWGTIYTMTATSISVTNYNTPYDNIVGMWLVRLLNYTLSENTLRSGLNSFLYDRSYKTFVLDNIISALTEQARRDWALPAGVTVPQIVKSWLKTKLFPIVTVFRNYKTRTAHVEQKAFILNKSDRLSEREQDLQWYIPLVLVQSDQPQERFWNVVGWMKEERTINLDNMPPSDVSILINPDIIGLFVVNYDPTNWGLITQNLHANKSSQRLSEITHAKLITDAFLLANAGELTFSVPLNMSLTLTDETDFPPWYAFKEFFWDIYYKLEHTRTINLFVEYGRTLLSPLYEQFGGYSGKYQSEDRSTQDIVESIMCNLGAEDCIEALASKNSFGNGTHCLVLKWGDREIWDDTLLWALGHNDNRHPDKNLLTRIAACTRDKDRMNKFLEAVLLKYALSDDDVLTAIDRIKDHYLLFNYVSDKWFEIKKKYQEKRLVFEEIVFKTTSKFVTSDGYDLVAGFYSARQRDTPRLLSLVSDAMRNIVDNSKWYDRSLPQIETWIRRYLSDD
ncbi:aminopeptidase Ey-like [Schistocerca americana]|uniref:aminopeptidase Ey-like n=1 Tax=Schistocerca americana TaxID=7009 RepID=UPI001F4F95F3|nr:aminopeptidase Ey-like [Schistocerca americana]XP_046980973.1 aminopeptidase Ey-like [Schistocerca americana]